MSLKPEMFIPVKDLSEYFGVSLETLKEHIRYSIQKIEGVECISNYDFNELRERANWLFTEDLYDLTSELSEILSEKTKGDTGLIASFISDRVSKNSPFYVVEPFTFRRRISLSRLLNAFEAYVNEIQNEYMYTFKYIAEKYHIKEPQLYSLILSLKLPSNGNLKVMKPLTAVTVINFLNDHILVQQGTMTLIKTHNIPYMKVKGLGIFISREANNFLKTLSSNAKSIVSEETTSTFVPKNLLRPYFLSKGLQLSIRTIAGSTLLSELVTKVNGLDCIENTRLDRIAGTIKEGFTLDEAIAIYLNLISEEKLRNDYISRNQLYRVLETLRIEKILGQSAVSYVLSSDELVEEPVRWLKTFNRVSLRNALINHWQGLPMVTYSKNMISVYLMLEFLNYGKRKNKNYVLPAIIEDLGTNYRLVYTRDNTLHSISNSILITDRKLFDEELLKDFDAWLGNNLNKKLERYDYLIERCRK